ncbi:MAG: SH3 domain-containing protein [Chloroflexi bacterium]|nr:MAG: SH3 domain-containing protein [Chloroflexota bacterium]
MRWLVLGLLGLLLGAACNSLENETSLATIAHSSTPSPTQLIISTPGLTLVPYIVSQPIPTSTPACPSPAPSTRMIVNERGWVIDDDTRPLNVRSGPSTQYRIIGQLNVGTIFFVLEGPVCSERYVWYRVEHGDLIGWVAEGDNDQYYIEPYFPG